MTATQQAPAIDMAKLEQFVFRAVDEVGATLNTALVVMGDRLGFYRALAGACCVAVICCSFHRWCW